MKVLSSMLILSTMYTLAVANPLSGYYDLSNPHVDSDGTQYIQEIQFFDTHCMLHTSIADSTSTKDGYLFNFVYNVEPYKIQGNKVVIKTRQYSSKESKLVNGEIVYTIDKQTIFFSKDFQGKEYKKEKTSLFKQNKTSQFATTLSKWKESFLDKKDPIIEYRKAVKDAKSRECIF